MKSAKPRAVPSCFKTYDVRGCYPSELNEELAYRIGVAFAQVMSPRNVVVGRDARLSSPSLEAAVCQGLVDSGVEVKQIGLCGTEIVYFACFRQDFDGGIMVTASHNPKNYNGMKMVGKCGKPVTSEQLGAIQRSLDIQSEGEGGPSGQVRQTDPWPAYLDLLTALYPPKEIGAWKVVANGGYGAVGPLLHRLSVVYPKLDLVLLNEVPDGHFPDGVPNPLLPEKRAETSRAVREHGADLGVAWDGDYDRCFFFDDQGEFVETYYLLTHFAKKFLRDCPGGTVLYDPRLFWQTVEGVAEVGGNPQICRTGHVFFKQQMAHLNAVYGGEMSGHHYFREFGNCDSGIIPFLLLLTLLNESGHSLRQLVEANRRAYPISGEINRKVDEPGRVIERVREAFLAEALSEDRLDGLSMELPAWRFNLRTSNTEPLLRLNVEARESEKLLDSAVERILSLIDSGAG